jgi:division protein CdvB (Snf7/Vps24/ESCRT-III family)
VRNLEREEAKLVQQIKIAAKRGPEAATPLAKQLVKLRQQKTRLQGQTANLKGLNTAMRTQAAMHKTAQAMGASAAAMGKVCCTCISHGYESYHLRSEPLYCC